MASSKSTIPVTVIGYGSSARTFHLPFIASLPARYRLHSIQQRPGSKSGPDARTAQPGVIVHPSIDSVFGSSSSSSATSNAEAPLPEGGLVVITIANKLHAQAAKQALLAGRHVLCEKPLALSAEDALELDAIAQEKGLLCSAFQNRRFDGDFLTVRSLLDASSAAPEESLGEPLFFESHFDRFRPLAKGGWREETPAAEGGGILWDLGSHLVDQAITLFGPPESLLAVVRNSRGQQSAELDDSFHLQLFYGARRAALDGRSPGAGSTPAGLHVVLSASVLAAHTDAAQLRFRVHGSRGSYEKRALDPQEAQLKAGWTPASHAEAFGAHAHDASEAERFGTLTTLEEAHRDWAAQPSDPTKPPRLVERAHPVRQGRYVDLYANLADVIAKLNALPADDTAARRKVLELQHIKTRDVAAAVRVLELARQSAQEGRVVKFSL